MHFSVTDFIQLAVCIVSLSVFLQKPAPLYLKWFPIYFFYFLITGFIIEYTSKRGIHNTGLANVSSIMEFCFYFYVLGKVIVNPKFRRGILFTMLIFVLFASLNLIFIQKFDEFNPVNFTIGSLITVIFCIYYFVELFQMTEAPSLSRLPAFWIVSAILLNIVLTFPMFALLSFLAESNLVKPNLTTMMIIKNIDKIYNIILLLTGILYSIGFLCRIRTIRSTL
jgi:hypothetical protein